MVFTFGFQPDASFLQVLVYSMYGFHFQLDNECLESQVAVVKIQAASCIKFQFHCTNMRIAVAFATQVELWVAASFFKAALYVYTPLSNPLGLPQKPSTVAIGETL